MGTETAQSYAYHPSLPLRNTACAEDAKTPPAIMGQAFLPTYRPHAGNGKENSGNLYTFRMTEP